MNKLYTTIAHDKALHYIGGSVLAALGGMHSIVAGAVLCAVVAVGWEVYQRVRKSGHPSLADVQATLAGGAVVLAPLVVWRLQ